MGGNIMLYPITQTNNLVRLTEYLVPMSDGVRLYTRVAVPAKEGTYPIVFIRTPYEESHNGKPHGLSEYEQDQFIQNNFAVVFQHCRGRGDSEGICVPHGEIEGSDGLDTLAFIRSLPFYRGEIFLFGGSYRSTVHLMYLGQKPADIKGAALSIQTDRMYFKQYRNGCCYNFCSAGWIAKMLNRQYPDAVLSPDQFVRPYIKISQRLFGEDVPALTEPFRNDAYNDFWRKDPRTNVIDSIDFPVLFVEGWYDFYVPGMFSMWERLPKKTKEQSAFLVGPWGHATTTESDGQHPFPNGDIPTDYAVQWFRSIRSGDPAPFVEKGMVHYYSVGGDVWRTADYPLQSGSRRTFWFGADGSLLPHPGPAGECTYTYDPNAVQQEFCGSVINSSFERVEKSSRNDGILSFYTTVFKTPAAFFGPIRWHMDVRSDCEDTAFLFRICLSEPDGDFHLTDTITSLSHIDPAYIPNQKLTLDLETPPIAFTVNQGCRIRVDISSSGGAYVPHANVRGHWSEVTETKIASNSLICGQDAWIQLPEEQLSGADICP